VPRPAPPVLDRPHDEPRRGTFPRRQARRRRWGVSLVEFSLVGPMVIILIFGGVDFGRALYHDNQLTNAAQEGARIAELQDRPCNTVSGSATGSTCPTTSISGEASVCQAIENEGSLIPAANWHCVDVPSGSASTVGTLPAPSAAAAGNAYVEIDQYQTTTATTPCTGTPVVVTTPRLSGSNYAVKVTIDYYFRPFTPVVSSLFPSTFHLETSACVRGES
jgi:Flp pilus assembly protein TadG